MASVRRLEYPRSVTPARSTPHIVALDGLRGVAVGAVLLFHSEGLLRGGFLGVDLFFVLSGYLITSLLIAEHETRGRLDLLAFWGRRLRRLLPAMLALVLYAAIYARFVALPSELASLRADMLSTLGYVSNWRAIFAKRSYWDLFLAPSPLEHTWSLSIEEQFYVVWPLVAYFVFRFARNPKKALFVVASLCAVASNLSLFARYDADHASRVYLATDTRAGAIALGAMLACLSPMGEAKAKANKALTGLSFVAFAGILGGFVVASGEEPLLYRGGFLAFELATLVLLEACVRSPEGPAAKVLSLRPLGFLGEVSYGLYLWHWPIFGLLTSERTHLPPWLVLVLRLVASLMAAALSYRFLEMPIRRRQLVTQRPAAVALSAVVVCAGISLVATIPRKTLAEPTPDLPELVVPTLPFPAGAIPDSGVLADSLADSAPPVPFGALPDRASLPPDTLRVLVLGDSVGQALGAYMRQGQSEEHAFVAPRCIGDCSILSGVDRVTSMAGDPPGNGNCASSWNADVTELRPDVTLIVIGGAYFMLVRSSTSCSPVWQKAYSAELRRRIMALQSIHSHRVVLALAAYPVGKFATPVFRKKVDCYDRVLTDVAKSTGAEILDLSAHTCPEGQCLLESEGAPIRPDGLHYDGPGSRETAAWVLRTLRGTPQRESAK